MLMGWMCEQEALAMLWIEGGGLGIGVSRMQRLGLIRIWIWIPTLSLYTLLCSLMPVHNLICNGNSIASRMTTF